MQAVDGLGVEPARPRQLLDGSLVSLLAGEGQLEIGGVPAFSMQQRLGYFRWQREFLERFFHRHAKQQMVDDRAPATNSCPHSRAGSRPIPICSMSRARTSAVSRRAYSIGSRSPVRW